jgi:hypothetical protein
LPAHLGTPTQTVFLKGVENHKLHEEFEVEGLTHTLTLSGALVTSNTINGNVGGVALAETTFSGTSDATWAAVAALISAMDGVKSATVTQVASATDNDRVIVVVPEDQVGGVVLTGFVVAAGAGQATITVASVDKRIYKGMPVELNATSGKIQPLTAATASTTHIGWAIMDAVYGEFCTVALNGMGIVNGIAGEAAVAYGPVIYTGFDSATKLPKFGDTSVTATNLIGWALDDATQLGEKIRVIMKS